VSWTVASKPAARMCLTKPSQQPQVGSFHASTRAACAAEATLTGSAAASPTSRMDRLAIAVGTILSLAKRLLGWPGAFRRPEPRAVSPPS
jgi:hypothetical protein